MEIEAGARMVSERTSFSPVELQKTKDILDLNYKQFKAVPDWQKWRLIAMWSKVAIESGKSLVGVSKFEWSTRTKITEHVLKLESKGVPPSAVIAYRALLWDYLNKGEFSKDVLLEDKIRQHLRCWDEWAEASRQELDMLDRGMRWYSWLLVVPAIYRVLVSATIMAKRTRRAYEYMEIAEHQLTNYEKDKEPHPASVKATRVLMDYLKESRNEQ